MTGETNPLLDAALEYAGRGWAVVPVKFEKGKKRGAVRWKRCQTEFPDSKRLRAWFRDGKYPGLAVILGPISGHLACRDFDEAEAYHAWAKRFPELAERLPTVRTGRGFHVYFTAPATKTVHFRDGELRGAKSLCVLPPSPHPKGGRYEWLVQPDGPVPQVVPGEAGLAGEPVQQKQSEDDRCSPKQAEAVRGKPSAKDEEDGEVELAITATLPNGPGQRNSQVFQFARALRGIPSLADADPRDLRPIVKRWHSAALPHIRTKPFVETWMDFLYAWPRVETPMRRNLMEEALKKAIADPVPGLDDYDQKALRDLVALCRELQAITGREPFFLSTRTAARLFGINPATGWRWLYLLEQDGWIVTVEKGNRRGFATPAHAEGQKKCEND